jgi:penicillin-binding protein 2
VSGDERRTIGEDRRSLPVRLAALQWTTCVVFACLAGAFWYLQVVQHTRYGELAENNHQRTLALRAPRGMLFDRDGRLLVENRQAFNIALVREQSPDIPGTLRLLAQVAGVDPEALQETVRRHEREPRYRPILLIPDASLAQVTAVLARRHEMPSLIVERVPTRRYPDEALAAHLFGYVGEVTEAQLASAANAGLRSGDLVGQAGVEQTYNQLLMGEDGARRVVVNSAGREIQTVGEIVPAEGQRLQLTIDYDLQRAAEDAFKAMDYAGAAIVLDPRNGEVLSLVSLPAYDPNAFASGVDRATWTDLNTNQLRPLQNRAIQGRYSPGSTFKIVVALAALEEGLITPDHRVFCPGGANFYGRWFRCHLAGGHGSVDLRHALEKSCNVYFYTLGNMVGIDRLHLWAERLGLADRSDIDLPHEVDPIMPSTAWKLETQGEKWYAGETISVAIGQGAVSSTPIALASMIATLANGGTRQVPHLVRAVADDQGRWQPVPPPPPKSVAEIDPENLQAIREGLWMVVNAAGTGGRARIPGRDVAGKTGTAQVISNQGRQRAAGSDRDLRDHGWFVFFAPHDAPEIAGVVFAEHSEHGYLAAPIGRHVMETYFAKKEGRPLPVFAAPPRPAPAVLADAAPPVHIDGGTEE